MEKSVYSVVLMDDVVAAVDRLAYEAGTSRSNMMNRILAEYARLDTPEQRMQDIFSAVTQILDSQSILQPMLNASDAMLSLRSALQYKYNPSVRYVVELYPRAEETFGELRVSLRTQNPTLLFYLTQFYGLWNQLEAHALAGAPRAGHIDGGRYTRQLRLPASDVSNEALGTAIADYVRQFDACLKAYFNHLGEADAASFVHHVYSSAATPAASQL